MGQIHPSSSNGHKFIITTIDYFTKWVEVVPSFHRKWKNCSFVHHDYIICRYGVPSSIITDNGGQLKNKDRKELCKKFKITQHWSSIYYPHGNGQAKASNKAILKLLHHTVRKFRRDWHLEINPDLCVYRTSIKAPTSTMPFALVYGVDAMLLIGLRFPL